MSEQALKSDEELELAEQIRFVGDRRQMVNDEMLRIETAERIIAFHEARTGSFTAASLRKSIESVWGNTY